MDPPLNTTNAAAAVRPSINGVDSEDLLAEAKSGRTINFAEKLHLVLSNKECQGKFIGLGGWLADAALLDLSYRDV